VTRFDAVTLVVLTMSLLAASSAYAQDSTAPAAPAAMAPPPAAAPMPADRPLYDGTHFGIAAVFGVTSPAPDGTLFLAGNTGAVLWGLGVDFKYDGNAVAGPTNPGGDKTTASGVLSLAYMVHNQFPFAMGPEIDYITTLSPKAFDTNIVQAGLALWYAPFNIPAVIGTGAFVQVVIPPSPAKEIITTLAPQVRVVFGFH
jgi:hypothetical protein